MDTDKKAQIQSHARAIAALLYSETEPEQITTLASIEEVVRGQILEHVSPEIGDFLSKRVVEAVPGANAPSPVFSDSSV